MFADGAPWVATWLWSTAGGGTVRLLGSSVTVPLSSVRRVLRAVPNAVKYATTRVRKLV